MKVRMPDFTAGNGKMRSLHTRRRMKVVAYRIPVRLAGAPPFLRQVRKRVDERAKYQGRRKQMC